MNYLRSLNDSGRNKTYKCDPNDPQVHLVYRAECKLKTYHTFRSEKTAREFMQSVVHSRWWRARFSHIRDVALSILDEDRAFAEGFSDCAAGIVRLDWPHLAQDTMLHELAHTIVEAGKSILKRKIDIHGIEFVGVCLALTRKFLPKEYYETLRLSYIEEGVEFIEPDDAEWLWNK